MLLSICRAILPCLQIKISFDQIYGVSRLTVNFIRHVKKVSNVRVIQSISRSYVNEIFIDIAIVLFKLLIFLHIVEIIYFLQILI